MKSLKRPNFEVCLPAVNAHVRSQSDRTSSRMSALQAPSNLVSLFLPREKLPKSLENSQGPPLALIVGMLPTGKVMGEDRKF